ncbi:stage II sporulation protein M [Terrilactibacillus sp. BCM23-1]|uniref:Stage II sporulation protein M n=1 Tax=Terrilactibacillus tamarindi TaxID=2599694 RepID=A0A6N8CMG0_9BACI|nr:stage II sporulation protein M [Terrilactibacillus tamarindi]MTT31212.1 stage II sporulation protein M [Terrilactibacillus tamarindi]
MNQKIKRIVMKHVQENLPIYTFVVVLFLMGVIFGAIIVNSLPYESKKDLYTYISRFFTELSKGNVASPQNMLAESFTNYVQYMGFMWILGLSVIGLPIIFILLFLKGIVLGFTVGFLVNQMGFHGFWVSLASVFPQNVFIVPLFIITGAVSISFSLKMFRQLLMKTRKAPLWPQFIRYGLFMVLVCLVLLFVSTYEAYISPVIIRSVVH